MWSLALCVAPSTLFVHMVTPSLSVCMGVISLSLSLCPYVEFLLYLWSVVFEFISMSHLCVCVLIWVF